MSYTNSTPNYGLPQYVADDKPTYLGDFNSAMSKIDTEMKTIDNKSTQAQTQSQNAVNTANSALETAEQAQSNVSGANSLASQANTKAQTALDTANTANTNANQAKTDSQTAKTDSQTAIQNSSQALQKANNVETQLNNLVDWTPVNVNSGQSGATAHNYNVNCSKNLKLMSLFGFSEGVNSRTAVLGTLPEGYRPSKNVQIQNGGSGYVSSTQMWEPIALYINTNGQISINETNRDLSNIRLNTMICLATDNWDL